MIHEQLERLEAMGQAYGRSQRSFRRWVLIILAAILFNLGIITVFLNVFGYSTAHPLPWLIRVKIVPRPHP